MPADAPNPDAAIAETNDSNRAAIIAKSQSALAAAIAQVNGELATAKPAPKPEAVATQPAAEPAEEPVDAPEPPQEAPASEPAPVDRPPEKVSAKLEAAARSLIRSRNQKREMEAMAARNRQLEAELQATKEDRELAAEVRRNPLAGIKKAGHDPARVVPDWLALATEPEQTPEQKAAEANQKKLDDLEAFQKRLEDGQRQTAAKAQIASLQQLCAEAIADKTAFEFVHMAGGTPELWEYMVDTYSRAKAQRAAGNISEEQLAYIGSARPAEFAVQMEKELRAKFGKKPAPAQVDGTVVSSTTVGTPQKVRGRTVDPAYTDAAKNVRGSRSIRQKQDYAAKVRASVADEPTTLSARNSGARTVPFQRKQTERELIENAKRAFETGKPILRQ